MTGEEMERAIRNAFATPKALLTTRPGDAAIADDSPVDYAWRISRHVRLVRGAMSRNDQ